MKYLINKKTGEKYCLHCKSYKCICLPEGESYFDFDYATEVEFKYKIRITDKADKFIFYKQTLPNGRVIKSNAQLIVPKGKHYPCQYIRRPKIHLSNDIINQAIFDN